MRAAGPTSSKGCFQARHSSRSQCPVTVRDRWTNKAVHRFVSRKAARGPGKPIQSELQQVTQHAWPSSRGVQWHHCGEARTIVGVVQDGGEVPASAGSGVAVASSTSGQHPGSAPTAVMEVDVGSRPRPKRGVEAPISGAALPEAVQPPLRDAGAVLFGGVCCVRCLALAGASQCRKPPTPIPWQSTGGTRGA